MYPKVRTGRQIWLMRTAIAIAVCFVLFIGFVYAYDRPGGISDWRYARASGISGTIKIPLGATPEEAVRKFRSEATTHIIYREPVAGGALLFTKLNEQKEGNNLGIEFVQKTLLGWKWVYGGTYSYSAADRNEALNFMSIPKYKGIKGPFPIIFGQITNSAITSVKVTVGGDKAGVYNAKIISEGVLQRIWYVILPAAADKPYKLEALNREGNAVASKTSDDPTDFGSIMLLKK
ncbi:hypothetical protein [Paenibacillus sp. JDR-2]|uniref:hypothetical protein n=1 Tax=Paenibacillus sp. (strain JDR-2) TaxID=324057 RepID=UPI000166AC42|nr:hypothetical protein [Paenibacillus sp. JDR-2]ACT04621.1 hypothetical protein Pjdr2_6017 [Paenibacillus sp. JDR-2]